ncbi:MAG: hypothetical protein M3P49_09315 [Actinomycetota bacterium]|nr:hypothetical protein [Actinomycetota bacterium]
MSEEKNPNGGDSGDEKPSSSAPPPRRPAPVDHVESSEDIDNEQTVNLSEGEDRD